MIKLVIIYWVGLNTLVVVGGIFGWLQLKRSDQRVSHYLARILMAEALRGLFSLWGTGRFRSGLEADPAFMLASIIVITALSGAIWGWLLYSHGFINGGGWWGLFKQRDAEAQDARHITDERN